MTKFQVPQRVVVGVDGSEQSKLALRWSERICSATGARLEAIAAWEFPTTYGWASVPLQYNPAQDMDKLLTETVDQVFGTNRPTDMVLSVREGGAAKVLREASRGALMVVVGSRGHGGFIGLLMGSVSASIAEHAHCPVLVVREEPKEESAS